MIGDDALLAGRLLQYGLRRNAKPGQEPEYAGLIAQYRDRPEFRRVAHSVASGLFLEIVDVSERGVVLAAPSDSVFAPRTARVRGQSGADERLIAGLVQAAIATAVFPRPTDLEDHATIARMPVTVDDVEDTLRQICTAMEHQFANRPSETVAEEEAGLYDAWQVFHRRAPEMLTRGGKRMARGTRRTIEASLDLLATEGMFRAAKRGGETAYQPLHAYVVQVRDYAATRIASAIETMLENHRNDSPPMAAVSKNAE